MWLKTQSGEWLNIKLVETFSTEPFSYKEKPESAIVAKVTEGEFRTGEVVIYQHKDQTTLQKILDNIIHKITTGYLQCDINNIAKEFIEDENDHVEDTGSCLPPE